MDILNKDIKSLKFEDIRVDAVDDFLRQCNLSFGE